MITENFFLEKERIPVFIGKEGKTREEFEKVLGARIEVNSNSGEVIASSENSISLFVLSQMITAINLGHNPEHALLLNDEHYVLDVMDVKPMVRDSRRLKVVLGRIIGKDGSTRKAVGEITKCYLGVYDHTVSIIGPYENVILVHEALDMLISGSSHKSFYAYLERNSVKDSKF